MQMPRRVVVSRSSLSFAEPRPVGKDDVRRVLSGAVRVREGKIVRAKLLRWRIDEGEVDNPVGAFGGLLEADIELLLEG